MFSKIRNNPKKTIFFSSVLCYGFYYLNGKLKDKVLRRELCNDAREYGDKFIHPLRELTRITVIHNPVANNRKSAQLFQTDVYPLLNLHGFKVTVVETERAEEAKELMSVLKPEDQECLFVAGGDGTLLEVATGLLRRSDLKNQTHRVPLLTIPLGKWNSFFSKWTNITSDNFIRICSESVNLIEKNQLKPSNVILIRSINEEFHEPTNDVSDVIKPKEIYALSGLDWSVDRDIYKNGKRKWLFGPYRHHFQYFLSGLFGEHLSKNKSAILEYKEKCEGCSKCVGVVKKGQHSSSRNLLESIGRIMLPVYYKDAIAKEKEDSVNFVVKSKIINEKCGELQRLELIDVRGISVTLNENQLKVKIKNIEPKFIDHVTSGIKSLRNVPYSAHDNNSDVSFDCKELKIIPEIKSTEKFYIDNEELEVVPLELSVLQDALYFYT